MRQQYGIANLLFTDLQIQALVFFPSTQDMHTLGFSAISFLSPVKTCYNSVGGNGMMHVLL